MSFVSVGMEERAIQRAEQKKKIEEAKQQKAEEKLVREAENETKCLSHHSSYKKYWFNARVRDWEKTLYPKQEFYDLRESKYASHIKRSN